MEWSGQYEHQLHAQRTLSVIVPTVLAVTFVLLFIVYRSAKEAAHVILAVPFALSGGVFLQWALGYPFQGRRFLPPPERPAPPLAGCAEPATT